VPLGPKNYRGCLEHEAVLEAMQGRLEKMPNAARIRRQTAEHVFGTLKSWMGASHFLMKSLPNEDGDEPACAGLQSETCDADLRCDAADENNEGMSPSRHRDTTYGHPAPHADRRFHTA
jgi:hypothetical protein